MFPLCQTNIPLKSLYLVIMSNLTHLWGRKTKIEFMSRILEKIYVGSETGSGSGTNWTVGSGSGKNHSGSRTLVYRITSIRQFNHDKQRYTEMRDYPRPSSLQFCARNTVFWLSWERLLRSTYVTFNREGGEESVLSYFLGCYKVAK